MDTVTTVGLICIFVGLAVLAFVRLTGRKPRHDPSDHFIGGDIAAVPREFKLRNHSQGSIR